MGEIFKNTHDVVSSVWEPPGNETIKINFDAYLNQNTKQSVSGIIARNKDGLVMAAYTFPWVNVLDSTTAEARACLQAITMAEEMGFRDICVEGDALTVIRKLNTAEEYRLFVSRLIQEIEGRRSAFRSVRFKYVPRGANKAAHEMAKEGGNYDFPRYWIEEAPATVERAVIQERGGDEGR
ncbi:hypothetical protein J1N35_036000 [Gossypium stocksii]|uniref:RNase H type-1 domain-containing protein n=1 Tax=Gossypium stocksii TaxID=47602 RepID=A0A9D3UVD8_9ROSI|nr:hypothetical protein J1N35_036000 [Gossypium stocksii]